MKLRLFFVLLFASAVARADYPSFVATLALEINALHPTQDWSYSGVTVDAAGWYNYSIKDSISGSSYVVVHVQTPTTPVDAAFLGDSTVQFMRFETLAPDVNTLNAGDAGHCTAEPARLAPVLAVAPKTIVLVCGTDDIFHPTTSDLSDTKAAMVSVTASIRSAGVGVLWATVTPVGTSLPTEPGANPSQIAATIRSFNAWLRSTAAASSIRVWDRWLNIAASEGNFGVPMCYSTDEIHPYYCTQMLMGGLRYQVFATELQK